MRMPPVTGAGDDLEMREIANHGLGNLYRFLEVGHGQDQDFCMFGAGGSQQVRS